MKQMTLCAMILIVAAQSFCQTSPTEPFTREDFLKKSKNQNSAGWTLLGGGSVLVLGGLLIGNGKESTLDDATIGALLGAVGVISAIGSIPLFIASGRNKRRAANASTYLKVEQHSLAQTVGTHFHSFPAAGIRVRF